MLTEAAIMDKREGLHGMKVNVIKCEAEERYALLQQEKANMAVELQAMEDQQVASASAEQHDDGE